MHCCGELKSLRAQSVGEVSAYYSRVQLSGYMEKLATSLATKLRVDPTTVPQSMQPPSQQILSFPCSILADSRKSLYLIE